MKPKRRIKAILRRLDAASQSEEIQLAAKVLNWVLDDDSDFNDIFKEIEEPKSKNSFNMFAYDKPQEVWIMPNPYDGDEVYLASTRPNYTPVRWWTKVELDNIDKNIVYGEDFLELKISYKTDIISWVEIDNIFNHFRDLFRNRDEVEKYVKNFFNIDETDKLLLTSEERKNFQKANNINPNELKTALEKAYQAEWLYTYRKKGDDIWALKKRT